MNKQEIIKRLSALSADEDRCKYCNSSTISGGDIYCSAGHSRDMDCDGKDFKIDYKIEEVISALENQLTNGWIPVSESPTEYGTYMVAWRPINMTETDVKAKTMSQNPHFYEMLEYDPEDEAGWVETIEQSVGAYEILAWQPLPDPYKELATDNNVVTKSGKDNNVLTIGDKIRESNRSLADMLGSLCSHGATDIKTFEMRGWTTKKWLDYLDQPYTDTTN